MSLWPRPRSCGKTNHIQWLLLRPAVNSETTFAYTASWAVTNRCSSAAWLRIVIPRTADVACAWSPCFLEPVRADGGLSRDRPNAFTGAAGRWDELTSIERPDGPRQNRRKTDPCDQGYTSPCRSRVHLFCLAYIGGGSTDQSTSGKSTCRETTVLEK